MLVGGNLGIEVPGLPESHSLVLNPKKLSMLMSSDIDLSLVLILLRIKSSKIQEFYLLSPYSCVSSTQQYIAGEY